MAVAALAVTAQAQQGGPPQGGMGGPGGGVREDRPVLKQFDANGDGWLNAEERAKAREFVRANPQQRGGPGGMRPGGGGQRGPGGPRGMGGPGGGGPRGNREAPKAGVQVSPSDVKLYGDEKLYDQNVLRTVFVEFENADWQAELADFHGTDVDVPATVTVDGKVYKNVGMRFRGNSSYNMIGEGYKKSFNVDFALADKDQKLGGYKTLNLLNANGDPTMMRAALYSRMAGESMPIAKANFMKVVVNGENWGIYGNVQQIDKIFLQEAFGDDKGIRWKTPGSPQGRAGLNYLGEDPKAYEGIYDIKTKKEKEAAEGWKALIALAKTLDQTPSAQLPKAIEPILDVDGVLRFLAFENALVNSDGYWVRSSDYNLYRDSKGKFHVIPHDFNETFLPEGGPGMGGPGVGFPGGPPNDGGFGGPLPDDQGGFPGGFPGGPPPGMGGGGADMKLDPMVGAKDERKPLISKLLAVPQYKAAYLRYVGEIATKWLDWKRVQPIVAGYDSLIGAEVKIDTRKLESYDAYLAGTGLTAIAATPVEGRGPGGRAPSLKAFVEERRKYLLGLPAVKTALAPAATVKKGAAAKAGKP
ncbi:spore coat protein CotH [bacterium]|nr:MAG: spore coat protein CotH [bacterium]